MLCCSSFIKMMVSSTQILEDITSIEDDEEKTEGVEDVYGHLFVNGISYRITHGDWKIGREQRICDIVIPNGTVSKIHAIIECEDADSSFIYDCNSTNKSKIGKMLMKPHVRYHLFDGAKFLFGDEPAKYLIERKQECSQSLLDTQFITDTDFDESKSVLNESSNMEKKVTMDESFFEQETQINKICVPESPEPNDSIFMCETQVPIDTTEQTFLTVNDSDIQDNSNNQSQVFELNDSVFDVATQIPDNSAFKVPKTPVISFKTPVNKEKLKGMKKDVSKEDTKKIVIDEDIFDVQTQIFPDEVNHNSLLNDGEDDVLSNLMKRVSDGEKNKEMSDSSTEIYLAETQVDMEIQSDIFEQQTQVFPTHNKVKLIEETFVKPFVVNINKKIEKEQNLFEQETQMYPDDNISTPINGEEETLDDLFDAPTQIYPEKLLSENSDKDGKATELFDAPTQIYPEKLLSENSDKDGEATELFDAPTQIYPEKLLSENSDKDGEATQMCQSLVDNENMNSQETQMFTLPDEDDFNGIKNEDSGDETDTDPELIAAYKDQISNPASVDRNSLDDDDDDGSNMSESMIKNEKDLVEEILSDNDNDVSCSPKIKQEIVHYDSTQVLTLSLPDNFVSAGNGIVIQAGEPDTERLMSSPTPGWGDLSLVMPSTQDFKKTLEDSPVKIIPSEEITNDSEVFPLLRKKLNTPCENVKNEIITSMNRKRKIVPGNTKTITSGEETGNETENTRPRRKCRRTARYSTESENSVQNDSPLIQTRSRRNSKQNNNTRCVSRLVEESEDTDKIRENVLKLKLNVLFTGCDRLNLGQDVTSLGGTSVRNIHECDVIVTDKVRRTKNFLGGLCLGKPIVSVNWLNASVDQNEFQNPWLYLLQDNLAETKWKFNLKTSLEKARCTGTRLLNGFIVLVTQNVKPSVEEVKDLCKLSGATILEERPQIWPNDSLILTCLEDKDDWPSPKYVYVKILHYEFVLQGILMQEINIDHFKLR